MAEEDLDLLEEEDENTDNTYLTFHVGGEGYAVSVQWVTEIVRLQHIFAVPDVPAFIKGVINLRGKVIPLLDVRTRFGLTESAYNDRTVIIVLERDEMYTGLVVDGVTEVLDIPPDCIEATQNRAMSGKKGLVSGIGKRSDKVVFVLDVDQLLSIENIPTGIPPEVAAAAPAAATA